MSNPKNMLRLHDLSNRLLLVIDRSCTCRVDDVRLPMSRVVHIPSSRMTPYRIAIDLRLILLGVFLHYRTTHPVKDAYALWLTSVICEIWFAFSWLLDQFPKWYPINRETFLDRLALRLVFIYKFVLLSIFSTIDVFPHNF